MKLIQINTDNYIVVDDSEIKEGDWCIMFDDYGNLFLGNQPQQYLGEQAGHHLNKGLKKITHSTQPLIEDCDGNKIWIKVYPLSLQEVKKLIGEVDVDKRIYDTDFRGDVNSYKQGYNQALEDNKEKKYTEKDLKKAIDMAEKMTQEEKSISSSFIDKIIQSLQPKTQWEVEIVDGKKIDTLYIYKIK